MLERCQFCGHDVVETIEVICDGVFVDLKFVTLGCANLESSLSFDIPVLSDLVES